MPEESEGTQRSAGGGFTGWLKHKVGPLPAWAWIAIGTGAAFGGYLLYKRKHPASSSTSTSGTGSTSGSAAVGDGSVAGGDLTSTAPWWQGMSPTQFGTTSNPVSTATTAPAAPVQGNAPTLGSYANNPSGAQAFIAQLYQTYLGRSGSPSELSYWAGRLTTGGESPQQVAAEIANTPEAQNHLASVNANTAGAQ